MNLDPNKIVSIIKMRTSQGSLKKKKKKKRAGVAEALGSPNVGADFSAEGRGSGIG